MADWQNQLYYGDNLDVPRRYIPAQSVDLVYLDPHFNFAEKERSKSISQIRAFQDIWEWIIQEKAPKRDPSVPQTDSSLFATQAN